MSVDMVVIMGFGVNLAPNELERYAIAHGWLTDPTLTEGAQELIGVSRSGQYTTELQTPTGLASTFCATINDGKVALLHPNVAVVNAAYEGTEQLTKVNPASAGELRAWLEQAGITAKVELMAVKVLY